MVVQVEGGRIRRIEPHGENGATSQGVCLKGLSYVERQNSRDRILRPLRRDPTRGTFDPISWDAAFEEIVGRLRRYRDSYGPQSILYYSGSGTKGLLNAVGMDFFRLLGGCTTTYGDLCWPAGLEATRVTLGENKHSVPWDLENARTLVLWGKNPAETNIHQMVFVENARRAGARLVVIDPRRTESAEGADLFLQPRPGTDGALALGLAHLLCESGKVDTDFVERHVLGWQAFRTMVEEYPTRRVSEICELPEESIRELAALLGNHPPVSINCGYGMQRYTNSGQAMRAILSLLALTGNIGKPGAGWIFANLKSHVFDEVRDPLAFYPPKKPDGVVRVSVSTARLGADILATVEPGLKMLWVERGNPVTQNPESNTVLEAFRSLEYRVVIEQFMTDTAREADLILPAKTLFEQTDVINAYWHDYIQIKQKVTEPLGEVKPETEVYHELARRLGLLTDESRLLLPGPSDEEVEAYLERRLAPFPELTLEALKKGPIPTPGREEVAFSDLVFPTPSGKIELVSEEVESRWGLDPLPRYQEPVETVRFSRGRGGPLLLMTPNTKNRIHSQFNNLEMIRRLDSTPTVTLNPEDAARREVRSGDRVRVANQRGELVIEARIDGSLRAGCAVIPNGWWLSEGGGVNLLSKGRETDLGFGAAFHENLVTVTRTS